MQKHRLETGTVLKTEGLLATVIINKSKACKECGKAQAGICGVGGAGMVMKVENTSGAKRGDTVQLGLHKNTLIKGYLVVFVLPVFVLIFSTVAGFKASQIIDIKDLDILAGVAGLFLSFLYSYKKIRDIDRTTQLHITRILYQPSAYENISYFGPEGADYLSAFNENH